nr:MAG TPA: hypothetical protein [Caudoviricetes sp.]
MKRLILEMEVVEHVLVLLEALGELMLFQANLRK